MTWTDVPMPLDLAMEPLDVLRAWPEGEPVAAMLSSAPGESGAGRSRWSILARAAGWKEVDRADAIVPGAGPRMGRDSPGPDAPAFAGGWIGFLSYELGGALEPRSGVTGGGGAGGWPLGAWTRCDHAYVHDNLTGRWWLAGDGDALPCVEDLRTRAATQLNDGETRGGAAFDGPLRSNMGRDAYERAVARAVEYIRAGDVFQVNLAHVFSGRMRGSPRELFAALTRSAGPWYGALLETPWGVIASQSPELFLDYDARTRQVTTRPMKGTRAGGTAGEGLRGAAELLASRKDAAELNMIVDLMRNDLGRVCEYGSVCVENAREVEAHGGASGKGSGGGVLQGVATVSGVVREEEGLGGLLRAAFPPGSITGAPKVRAMQIINELEGGGGGGGGGGSGEKRGPYCGCLGFVSDCGRAEFSVAIRTAVLTPADTSTHSFQSTTGTGTECRATPEWQVRYGVGAGIVADSQPDSEWRETLLKARIWQGIAKIEEN